MNELQFLRAQVALERGHMASVRKACSDALNLPADRIAEPLLEDFCLRCARYLVFIVARFNAQDQAHSDQLRPVLGPGDAAQLATLDDLDRILALNRQALGTLATALHERETQRERQAAGKATAHAAGHDGLPGAQAFIAACRGYVEFYDRVLAQRRHALAPLLEEHYSMAQWRTACRVTADAVLEERARYGEVSRLLPSGIALQARAQGTR